MPPLDHGALSQEVINLKEGHGQLRQDFRNLEGKVDSGFAMLVQKLDAKGSVNWQPIGILVGFLLSIGGALYWPVREAQSKAEAQIEIVRASLVPRAEHEKMWREAFERERAAEDRGRQLARDLSYLQGQLHPLPPR